MHSLVEFVDGSVLAQMGAPTMELPVLYALTHPERVAGRRGTTVRSGRVLAAHVRAGSATTSSRRFDLGIEAGRTGGAAPAVFNAANEQAVALVPGRTHSPSIDIASAIYSALETFGTAASSSRDALLAADADARRHVRSLFSC